MQSRASTRPEHQLQERIKRIAEGTLMLGGTLIGLWLLAVIAISFLK